jgi:hypothetical protein
MAMSWRKLLVVPNISELTLAQNMTNSADIAYSAEAESKLLEILTSLCLGLAVSPIEIRNSLSNDDINDWINTKLSTEVLRAFVLSLNERKLLAQGEIPNHRNTHTQNSQYTQKERADTPISLSIVSCNKCEHFTPDQIGDGAGIGHCDMGVKWTKEWCGRMPLYRYAERHCEKFSKLMS